MKVAEFYFSPLLLIINRTKNWFHETLCNWARCESRSWKLRNFPPNVKKFVKTALQYKLISRNFSENWNNKEFLFTLQIIRENSWHDASDGLYLVKCWLISRNFYNFSICLFLETEERCVVSKITFQKIQAVRRLLLRNNNVTKNSRFTIKLFMIGSFCFTLF